jgi:hypothetical protein
VSAARALRRRDLPEQPRREAANHRIGVVRAHDQDRHRRRADASESREHGSGVRRSQGPRRSAARRRGLDRSRKRGDQCGNRGRPGSDQVLHGARFAGEQLLDEEPAILRPVDDHRRELLLGRARARGQGTRAVRGRARPGRDRHLVVHVRERRAGVFLDADRDVGGVFRWWLTPLIADPRRRAALPLAERRATCGKILPAGVHDCRRYRCEATLRYGARTGRIGRAVGRLRPDRDHRTRERFRDGLWRRGRNLRSAERGGERSHAACEAWGVAGGRCVCLGFLWCSSLGGLLGDGGARPGRRLRSGRGIGARRWHGRRGRRLRKRRVGAPRPGAQHRDERLRALLRPRHGLPWPRRRGERRDGTLLAAAALPCTPRGSRGHRNGSHHHYK